MPDTTVGTTGAEKTGTESAAAKSVTPDQGANGSANSGVDARFAELTGELGRKNEKLKKLETEYQALVDKTKTDDERRIEQLATEKFAPQLAEATRLKDFLTKQRDELVAQIPDANKGLVYTGEGVPLEAQIVQAQSVLSLLNGKPTATPFSGGGNPGTEQKRTYSNMEYVKWSQSATSDEAYYVKHRDEMISAVKEGRVEGMR